MPSSWPIKRKNITFISKPRAGSHKLKYITSVLVLLRDVLSYAQIGKEVKHIVHNDEILVNGRKISDIKTAVGIFDTFEISKTKEKFTVLFDTFGRLKLIEAKDNLIYLKVTNKTITSGKKFQLNFMNGYNTLVSEKDFKKVSVNGTVVYDYSKKKISDILSLKEDSFVYIFDGKFRGRFGKIKNFINYNGITRDAVSLEINKEVHTTAKDYCYVVGIKEEDLKKFN